MPKSTKEQPKAAPTANGKTTPAPEATKKAPAAKADNRYLVASRIITKHGGAIDAEQLSIDGKMSVPTASYCIIAYQAVCQALREVGQLPSKPAASPKAPIAPKAQARAAPKPEPAKVGLVKASAA